MTEDRKPLNEGYRPEYFEKGYQPSKTPRESEQSNPQGGYQPTSEGDNPANSPPGKE